MLRTPNKIGRNGHITLGELGRSLALNRVVCHLGNMQVAQKFEAYIVSRNELMVENAPWHVGNVLFVAWFTMRLKGGPMMAFPQALCGRMFLQIGFVPTAVSAKTILNVLMPAPLPPLVR
jgi:hypothetical protein